MSEQPTVGLKALCHWSDLIKRNILDAKTLCNVLMSTDETVIASLPETSRFICARFLRYKRCYQIQQFCRRPTAPLIILKIRPSTSSGVFFRNLAESPSGPAKVEFCGSALLISADVIGAHSCSSTGRGPWLPGKMVITLFYNDIPKRNHYVSR